MKKFLSVVLGLTAFAFVSNAQPQKIVADKISAIVGDRIILHSDIKNSIIDAQRQGQTLPENAECMLLDQALVSKVLMLQAEKDSLVVTEEEVEAELDQRIRYFVSVYGSIEALENIANKTVYQIKDDARESVRERKLAEAMQRSIVDNVRITPAEVNAYFNKIPKDSLPFFESEVEIGQIVVYPKASRELEKYVIDELNNYRRQVESKVASFDQLAARYSEDPGVKENGGRYELNRNEKTWDPAFLAASFRLKDGEISPVIKSKFGYHIIQMVERNGDNATVKHILRIPPVTETEMNEAISKLDSVRAKVIAGNIDFIGAAGRYSEDESAKFAGPWIMSRDGDSYNSIDELPKDIVAILDKIKLGEITQPMAFTDERAQKKGVRILFLKSRSQPHQMNLRDDYNKIAQSALEEKKYNALEKWLTVHIPDFYVMIDLPGASCEQMKKWTGSQNTAAAPATY
jgi:peptidyl-prolyl cis-trans isomerase SurA